MILVNLFKYGGQVVASSVLRDFTRTLVLVLAPQLLGDVLLLQVLDALLFLLQPAEAPSPEGRVLLHEALNSDLWRVAAVLLTSSSVPLRRLSSVAVHVVVLETSGIKLGEAGSAGKGAGTHLDRYDALHLDHPVPQRLDLLVLHVVLQLHLLQEETG